MSQEGNVERLRGLYGEWAKGNLWALRDIADPEIEWEWAEGLASIDGGPRIYHGLDEIAAATLEWLAAWDAYWMTAEEFIPVGDRVVVLMCLHARSPETDYALEQRVGAVWALREGKAVSVRFYDNTDAALQAVGLRG